MRALPSGTVTFLFTDIEGSTRLLHELGDAYADLLAEHRRVLREAFGARGGVEVDTQGDAFFVAFGRASDAVAAAADAQRALADGPVRVRMGVHTGEPQLTDQGYVGVDVHKAARIMSAGHGGQVLLSQATRDLLDGSIGVRDLGEHRLKDLDRSERLFQLGDDAFPPLKTLSNTNLPARLEPLLGRKRELVELLRLVRRDGARLLTLVGPGGIGKTRLAQELAAELVGDFDHGVWFVDLSGLRDARLVLPTLASVVGAKESLVEHVGHRDLLVVLDNFEQVIDAAPEVGTLLASCERLVVLATSRESLRIAGERAHALRPLAEAPAVELFRQRAHAAAPGFDASYEELAELCRRLDALPLAIELAAARVGALTIDELSARLDRRLRLLGKGRRDAPARQRTLRAAIEWSVELLDDEERRAFERLAVFAGGWTLAAAEALGVDLDTLESLVDKSLVRHETGRYSMLETIREYAEELLSASAEADAIRRRHAEFVLKLADAANLRVEKPGPMRHELVNPERENINAALDWTVAAGEAELGARIVFELENYWVSSGSPAEGHRWATTFLERDEPLPLALRAALLRVCGNTTAIRREHGRALGYYERSLALYRELSDDVGVASMLLRVALRAYHLGDRVRARRLIDESVAKIEAVRVPKLESQALLFLAGLEFDEGRLEAGLALAERAAKSAEDAGFPWYRSGALSTIANRLLEAGRPAEAARRAREALVLDQQMDDREAVVFGLGLLAACAARAGSRETAGRLWGAAEAEHTRASTDMWPAARDSFEADVVATNDATFDRARREGQRLSLDQAIELALAP